MYLELNRFAVNLDGTGLEVDADGRNVVLLVRVVGKAEQQAALAHARVTNQQQLKQVITAPTGGVGGRVCVCVRG